MWSRTICQYDYDKYFVEMYMNPINIHKNLLAHYLRNINKQMLSIKTTVTQNNLDSLNGQL